MPVTKTAKRALRSSRRKEALNKISLTGLNKAFLIARKKPTPTNIQKVYSLADRAAKKKIIHKNKAARIKSQATKLVRPVKTADKK